MHAGVQKLIRDLNRVYRDIPALHQLDTEAAGFEWIDGGDVDNSVLVYQRNAKDGSEPVVVVCNFTPTVREGYRVGVPKAGAWREVLNTDAEDYGGSGVGNGERVNTEDIGWHGREVSLNLTLPPLATIVLAPVEAA
jgi:1,4-alpha-glucan branching enzyme